MDGGGLAATVVPRRIGGPTQGGWAANQMRATARLAVARFRWSLIFVKKLTIFEVSKHPARNSFAEKKPGFSEKPGFWALRMLRNS